MAPIPRDIEKILHEHQVWLDRPHEGRQADLGGRNLIDMDLRGYNLRNARFAWGQMQGAWLDGADCSGCDFNNANMSGIVAHGAVFVQANLRNVLMGSASINDADFSYAALDSATLYDTDFSGSNFNGADLTNVDFSGYANLACPSLFDNTQFGAQQKLYIAKGSAFLYDAHYGRIISRTKRSRHDLDAKLLEMILSN